jgi:hypothetical protein
MNAKLKRILDEFFGRRTPTKAHRLPSDSEDMVRMDMKLTRDGVLRVALHIHPDVNRDAALTIAFGMCERFKNRYPERIDP